MSASEDRTNELIVTPRRAARADAGRRRRRWIVRSLVGLLAVLALGIAGLVPLFRPASDQRRPVGVRVPTGASVAQIGQALEQKGVIRSAFAFTWYVRWRNVRDKLKAGRYALSGDMTLAEIVSELERGSLDDRLRITIPEGYTLRQIADALDAKGLTDGKALLQLATDPQSIAQQNADFPLPKNSLEGYFFPDTYAFRPHTPPALVLDTFLTNFSRRFVRPYQGDIAARGLSLHQIVTIASLIEREAKVPDDRPRIAGVLDNRLQRGMRLQVDATVLYALGHHKDRVYDKDLKVASPYNTYLHKGLPPGPIANPGLESLKAALHPEQNDFLYYVARPDGSHIFTRSHAEHLAAVRQARQERLRDSNAEAPGG
jgi:UPF0755 protein